MRSILIALVCSSCLASTDYVEERVAALEARDVEVAAAIVAPFEDFVPGITEYARQRAQGVVTAPPPESAGLPWEDILLMAGGILGIGIPGSVVATNKIRDRRRVARHEKVAVPTA